MASQAAQSAEAVYHPYMRPALSSNTSITAAHPLAVEAVDELWKKPRLNLNVVRGYKYATQEPVIPEGYPPSIDVLEIFDEVFSPLFS